MIEAKLKWTFVYCLRLCKKMCPCEGKDANDSLKTFYICAALNSQHSWGFSPTILTTFTSQLVNTQFREFDCSPRSYTFQEWGCCSDPGSSIPELRLWSPILEYHNHTKQPVTQHSSGLTITDFHSQFLLVSTHILLIVSYYGDMTYYWSLCRIVTRHI